MSIDERLLLRCPFCGATARIYESDYLGQSCYYVACSNPLCGCAIGERYDRDACPDHQFATELDALEIWNRRVKL